jgi:hypothetical protein
MVAGGSRSGLPNVASKLLFILKNRSVRDAVGFV